LKEQDFLYTAQTYGRILISEVFLPENKQTLASTRLRGRGICGGRKYIVHHILFKFALDSSNIFRGDELAVAKVAAHDLLGLNHYFHCNVDMLCFPLCCLIDYRGL
jgi:hypothetical protein